MKKLVTERDRYLVAKMCWDRVKRLRLGKAERKLLATQLEWDYWDNWRKQQAKED